MEVKKIQVNVRNTWKENGRENKEWKGIRKKRKKRKLIIKDKY